MVRVSTRNLLLLEWRLDPLLFASDIGFVHLDDWQERLLLSDHPNVIINAARQSGKSSTVAVVALRQALCFPSSLVLCLSPTLRQSSELFRKVLTYYWDLYKPVPTVEEQKLSIQLENGSRVVALPGNRPEFLRGFSAADVLLIDEASRVTPQVYHSVRPMLSTSDGRLLLLSTPNGRSGVFFDIWHRGKDWERYHVPVDRTGYSSDPSQPRRPRISEDFLEQERLELPRIIYDQEYNVEFVAPASSYFNARHVQDLLEPVPEGKLIDLGGGLKV